MYDLAKRICYLVAFMWIPMSSSGYFALVLAIAFSILSRKRVLSKNGQAPWAASWIAEEECNCVI
jgi:hypothetical protein